jgi:hypothetical protein
MGIPNAALSLRKYGSRPSSLFLEACINHLKRCDEKTCHIRVLLAVWTGETIPLGTGWIANGEV